MGADPKVQSYHQCLYRDETSLFSSTSITQTFSPTKMFCLQEVMVHACHFSIPEAEHQGRKSKASLNYKVKCYENKSSLLFSLFSFYVLRFELGTISMLGKCFILSHILNSYFSLRRGLAV